MRVTRNYMNALLAANKKTSRKSSTRGRSQINRQNPFASVVNTKQSSKVNSAQTNYQNMKNSAGEVQSSVSKLTDTGDNSVYARAEESGDKTIVTKQVKEFVEDYNSMVRSLKTSGSRVDNSYLNQLNAYAVMHHNALQATGVTKRADGTLSVDESTLNAASLEQLRSTWGSSSGFAAKAGTIAGSVQTTAVSGMNSLLANSYSNILRNFGSSGSFFNFWG
ncbi:MAG: hypothetical protein NC318_11585 [Blautia sp.]|nr:hypothetical protein [Lachnoclostridium sp.]MCM1212235.1 hypothetical protein [Blautia sp.]